MLFVVGLTAIVRGVIVPITGMTEVMRRLAEGDRSIAIPAITRRDEVGAMARAIQVFKDNALRVEAMESENDVRAQTEAERRDEIHKIADELDHAIGRIVQTVTSTSAEMESAASKLAGAADSTQQLAGNVAATSQQSCASADRPPRPAPRSRRRRRRSAARCGNRRTSRAPRCARRRKPTPGFPSCRPPPTASATSSI